MSAVAAETMAPLSAIGEISATDRVDCSMVSLVRAKGSELPSIWHLDHVVLLLPTQPLGLTVQVGEAGEDIELALAPYMACLLQPGQTYQLRRARCKELLVLGIPEAWMADMQRRYAANGCTLSRPIDTLLHPDIPPIVHVLERHISSRECPDEPYLALLTELLIARVYWHRQREAPAERLTVSLTESKLHEILLTIEDELEQRIHVASLAESLGMSPSRFSRAFKTAMGASPQRYILERRVLRAQQLLERSDLSLADISLESGYSSQAHMTAMFSRYFGIAPGEYRKHVRQRECIE